jgi:hypothetical protein
MTPSMTGFNAIRIPRSVDVLFLKVTATEKVPRINPM